MSVDRKHEYLPNHCHKVGTQITLQYASVTRLSEKLRWESCGPTRNVIKVNGI
jgi:hypothetical protein